MRGELPAVGNIIPYYKTKKNSEDISHNLTDLCREKTFIKNHSTKEPLPNWRYSRNTLENGSPHL